MKDIMCLQSQGAKKPLFLLPGSDGYALSFIDLAKSLGVERPIYGLQFPGLHQDISFNSIESLATYYLGMIRNVQETGPYAIAGWSMGGMVAFEMAKQLALQGDTLDFLAS